MSIAKIVAALVERGEEDLADELLSVVTAEGKFSKVMDLIMSGTGTLEKAVKELKAKGESKLASKLAKFTYYISEDILSEVDGLNTPAPK
jgi:glutamine synthetase type III